MLINQKENRLKTILQAGGEVTGSAISGALSFFLGGPLGAAAAGAIGTATGGLLADVASRILSHREQTRIGTTAQYVYEQIRINFDLGNEIRQDEFIQSKNDNPPPLEEVFEGMLLKAKSEHEEKKLKYLGQFFGNVAFDWYCTADQANYLLNLFERLTYQQLVMIRMFRPLNLHEVRVTRAPGKAELTSEENELIQLRTEEQKKLREGLLPAMTSGEISPERYAAYGALHELFQLGLVAYNNENDLNGESPKSMTKINFAATYSSTLGEQLHRLCGLKGIPMEDIDKLKGVLDYSAPIVVYVTQNLLKNDHWDPANTCPHATDCL